MNFVNFLLCAILGLLLTVASGSPMSQLPNISLLSKDPSHVFAPGMSMASVTFQEQPAGEARISGEIHNMCPFPVYVRMAIAATSSGGGHQACEHGGEETEVIELGTNGAWTTPYAARMDQCGHSIKIQRNRGDRDVYQVEYSMDPHDGRLWYNLSAENGAPFQDVDRWLGVSYTTDCTIVHCRPGQWGKDPKNGCDWPMQPQCGSLGNVVAYLCLYA